MSKTFWVFPITPELAAEVREVAEALHSGAAAADTEHTRKQFVRALNGIIDAGFEFYYERPAEFSSLNPVVKKAIGSIVYTVRQGIHLVVQRVFGSLNHADLSTMANYLDSMVLPPAGEGRPALLAHPLGQDLTHRLERLMETIRNSDAVSDYDKELYRLFVDVVEASVRYYYREPTAMISLNIIARKAADLGIDATVKGIRQILKRVIREVDHADVAALPENIHFLLAKRSLDYSVCSSDFIHSKPTGATR